MTFYIRFSKQVDWKKLERLPKNELDRLKDVVYKKIAVDPIRFGKPLQKSFKGCRSTRVGSFRIIYRVLGKNIDILLIAHRSKVYEE